MMEHALNYAARGWKVFPLHTVRDGECTCGKPQCPRTAKHPRTKNGLDEGTTDTAQINEWWTRWPDANIGVVTGKESGIVVVDVDPKHGGSDSLYEIKTEYGLPETVEVVTGSNGQHLFFKYPDDESEGIGNKVGLWEGIDIRGDKGYVVAAPSKHMSGGTYHWDLMCGLDDVEIAPIPEWLLNKIRKPKRAEQAQVVEFPATVFEGGRNAMLTSAAGAMQRRGMSSDAIRAAIHAENIAKCNPPLHPDEVDAIVDSIQRYEPSAPIVADIVTYGEGESQAIDHYSGSNVQPLPEDFFGGDKKTTFIPAKLGGYVWTRQHFFYNGARLYAYSNGVYRPNGERIAKQMMLALLKEKYKTAHVADALSWITYRSWKEDASVDGDDGIINLANGLYDYRSGVFAEHTPDRVSTIQIPVKYDSSKDCPRIKQFFREVLPEDAIPTMQEWFGYCLIPSSRFEKAIMMSGTGGNGKSVMIRLLNRFIGEENTANVALHDMEKNRFKLAQLHGKLLNTFADLSAKSLDESAVFKNIVSSDRMSAEFKGVDSFDFRPFARLVFSANEIPRATDVTDGFFRRWIMVPFPNKFANGSANVNLIDELTTDDELSGLLNWALEGLNRLIANNAFTMNETTIQTLEQYRKDSDTFGTFIEEMCVVKSGTKTAVGELYNKYDEWCTEGGLRPLGKINFNRRLRERFPDLEKKRPVRGGAEYWFGIGLLADDLAAVDGF